MPVDVRVIVATHRNLDELVKHGAFRQDLYHRIYVFPLSLPPLRERAGRYSRAGGALRAPGCGAEWLEAASRSPPEPSTELRRYSWPGNVRELRNVVERLLLLAGDQVDAATVGDAAARRGRKLGVLRHAGRPARSPSA